MNALDTFHHPDYQHNCAQAIAYRWRELYNDPDIVQKMAHCGSGRAPEGLCGALYAAMLACPDKAEELKQAFHKEIGHITCRQIKTIGRVPCIRCVQTADELVVSLGQNRDK